ncbi:MULTISPECIES: hypothetical protein [unclassified Mycobacterium]|uniref:hypothetical protein n=1 Tax=unclassified Mycobacterium TaxID=2642494 RepID=UPI0029C6D5B1|nr:MULTISPECIES: hypothetical protein [unclassified Mycobacterium]
MTKKLSIRIVTGGFLAAAILAWAPTAAADPAEFNNGFSNAQDTINTLKAQGYNVVLNGAPVYPLSGCKVTGVEGLRDSNAKAGGDRIDPTQFDTVYVDISCKGG